MTCVGCRVLSFLFFTSALTENKAKNKTHKVSFHFCKWFLLSSLKVTYDKTLDRVIAYTQATIYENLLRYSCYWSALSIHLL